MLEPKVKWECVDRRQNRRGHPGAATIRGILHRARCDRTNYRGGRLVDSPDLVQVNEIVGKTASVFELRVGEGELGKVIGEHGHTLRALRTILSGVGTKEVWQAILEILEQGEAEAACPEIVHACGNAEFLLSQRSQR